MVHSQQNDILSLIMLFTNECYHVITLVFLLSYFTLKFCLQNSHSNVRVSPSFILFLNQLFTILESTWSCVTVSAHCLWPSICQRYHVPQSWPCYMAEIPSPSHDLTSQRTHDCAGRTHMLCLQWQPFTYDVQHISSFVPWRDARNLAHARVLLVGLDNKTIIFLSGYIAHVREIGETTFHLTWKMCILLNAHMCASKQLKNKFWIQ
jgi:hypothetical protein